MKVKRGHCSWTIMWNGPGNTQWLACDLLCWSVPLFSWKWGFQHCYKFLGAVGACSPLFNGRCGSRGHTYNWLSWWLHVEVLWFAKQLCMKATECNLKQLIVAVGWKQSPLLAWPTFWGNLYHVVQWCHLFGVDSCCSIKSCVMMPLE